MAAGRAGEEVLTHMNPEWEKDFEEWEREMEPVPVRVNPRPVEQPKYLPLPEPEPTHESR